MHNINSNTGDMGFFQNNISFLITCKILLLDLIHLSVFMRIRFQLPGYLQHLSHLSQLHYLYFPLTFLQSHLVPSSLLLPSRQNLVV